MKTNRIIILSLAVFAVSLLTTPQMCLGEDRQDYEHRRHGEDARREEDMRRSSIGRHEMEPERIEEILQHIAERNPEKAEELRILKEENPAEFRKAMQQMFAKRHGRDGDGKGYGGEHKNRRFDSGRHGQRRQGDRDGRSDRMGMDKDKDKEYTHRQILDWLKKNYPEKAKKLAELKRENPKLFRRQMMLNLRKYRKIAEAAKENPELAKALKRGMELKEKRSKILKKLKNATNENQKQQLTDELKEVISDRFDIILQRKQAVYNQMLRKLDELKKEVEKHKAELDQHRNPDFKNKNVNKRLQKLVEQTKEFKWD